jgi:hypothetical protein
MAQRAIGPLTDAERTHLLPLTKHGQVAARQLRRAHTQLQADAAATAETIAAARPLGLTPVERPRMRFVAEGLEAALTARPRPGGPRQLAGTHAAFRSALACRTPPEARPCGTMP